MFLSYNCIVVDYNTIEFKLVELNSNQKYQIKINLWAAMKFKLVLGYKFVLALISGHKKMGFHNG